MTTVSEIQRARLYTYTKRRKNAKYIQKSKHFAKSKTICIRFIYTKIHTLYVTRFLLKCLKLAFVLKKHDTLCYLVFLYTKIRTLRKKQDNFCYVFIHRNPDTLCYAILHGIISIGRGGYIFLQKEIHFDLT